MVEPVFHPLIIPSVVIPFTALIAGLTALATFIAGLFGLKLKAEGPKKLLELLLTPRILISALAFNLLFIGAIAGYRHWKNAPVMLWQVYTKNRKLSQASSLNYPDSQTSENSSIKLEKPGQLGNQRQGKIEVLWTRHLGSGSFRGAAVSGSALFIGVDKGLIYELDPQDGSERRSFFTGTAISARPIIFQEKLFVGEGIHETHHARVYQFDLKSGQLNTTFESKGHIEGEIVLAKNEATVLVPAGSDGLIALEAKNLSKRWHVIDGHTDSGVLVANDLIFSGTGIEKSSERKQKCTANAYSLKTGERVWQRELPASSWMSAIEWRNLACFVFGEIYFPSEIGGFYCFNQKDGQPKFAFNHGTPIAADPIIIGDDLIFADIHAKVCRVSLQDGQLKWCQGTGEAKLALSNPVLDAKNNLLVYPSVKEGLFVIDPENGAIIKRWLPEGDQASWGTTYAPVTILRDAWLIVDMNGVARKLRWQDISEK